MSTNYFETLNSINVNGKTEEKNGFTYLSWPWAISEVAKRFPDFTYEVKKFDGKPYVYDPQTGYMVYTSVTIEGITREMWLPVMDSANRAMKSQPYKIKKYNKEIEVAAATMFDINKTIMRCLVKNFAMFGLGMYIFAGEDLPEEQKPEEEPPKEKKDAPKQATNEEFQAFVSGEEPPKEEEKQPQKCSRVQSDMIIKACTDAEVAAICKSRGVIALRDLTAKQAEGIIRGLQERGKISA